MAKENSLDSWIDAERMKKLLELVRPGASSRPSAPADADRHHVFETADANGTPLTPVDSLLPDEIPERAFVKGVRPRLPAPGSPRTETPAPPTDPTEASKRSPTAATDGAQEKSIGKEGENAHPEPAPPQPREVNPLTLYFHSTAPTPEERARAFVHWVRTTAQASAAFVVDGYGTAIAAEPETDSVFLASLSNLADALGRARDHFSRPEQNALHLELDDDRVLCLMQAKWDVATVALGLIRRTGLPREMAIRYRQELARLAQKPRRRPRD